MRTLPAGAPIQVVSTVVAHSSGYLSSIEAEMRTIIATLAGLLTVAAVSAQAAPLPPAKAIPAELGAASPIELVRDGCGHGWHRHHWRDYWGRWRGDRCVPNW